MGEKIVVGLIGKGLSQYYTPWNIDNDAFPVLQNAQAWRGRVRRKRGNNALNRLMRHFNSANSSYGSVTSIALNGSGQANLLSGFSLQTNGSIVPGSVTFTDSTAGVTYTDPALNGNLSPSGTINYATGSISIGAGNAGHTINTVSFNYYPDLPVMGLEDLVLAATEFPANIAFDTKYSYNILTSAPYSIYDVSFYKNPPVNASLPGYTPKTNVTPLVWNGQDYQQFYSTNYQNAFWASNGITDPFTVTNIGMQFKPIVTVTVTAGGPPAIVSLQITGHGLVVGDFLFINEVVTTTGINFQTGYVTTVTDANNVVVEFPNATIASNGTGGIAQYLTNNSDTTKDCLRWYDGDPTNGDPNNPVLNGTFGWVNFCPPLISAATNIFSIADLPPAQYYLVGARVIVPFKDRLLFIGPCVQTKSTGPFYLQDTIIYSQNGTPFYTCSFTGSPITSTTVFNPILLPTNQTATASSYFEDVTGFGGFFTAGISRPILSAIPNEDVLILGFSNRQARLVYTGNDILPFNLFLINSEYGTGSTFSAITLDRGALTIGQRGVILTSQVSSEREDLDIPDQIFEFNLLNNGLQRITAQRDFINEWIYFSFPSNQYIGVKFPNETLIFDYREKTWGLYIENFTTYGQFTQVDGDTWLTIGNKYPTWNDWNVPWEAGQSTARQPIVMAGNQQGFVFTKSSGTEEPPSLFIQSFSATTVTSPNHSLNNGDFIIITGCLGTIGASVNGQIFVVSSPTTNTFVITCYYQDIIPSGTYLGGGVITRMYVPLIQTKQFPVAWGSARKTRLGPQQYLLTTTDSAQIELQIYLSMDSSTAYNSGAIVPDVESENNTLIYTDTLFTCPESTNLGLTPANINLQMVTASQQRQIWHRMNTSLIGDVVQIGFTLSDQQMQNFKLTNLSFSITGATQANPCVLTCTNNLEVGQMVKITGVKGMTQLNNNFYIISAVSSSTVTINVDATAFSSYTSGGAATLVDAIDQFAEIELHGFILDVQPSQVLA